MLCLWFDEKKVENEYITSVLSFFEVEIKRKMDVIK